MLLWAAAGLLAAGLFLAVIPGNPPGSYRDESSISYNAYTVSQTGRDQYGAVTPLFFRSFGDYKSPAYVYLLAGVFRVAGPSIEAARLLSAVLGLLAVVALGLLATRITGRTEVGALTVVLAALTAWLFEVTRLVFEVAALPVVIVLFLHALWSGRERCAWRNALAIGGTLGLMTYTYAAGRGLAPLFALGLLFFARAWGWRGLARAWLVYVVTLVPLAVYAYRHPGALSARLGVTTYVHAGLSAHDIIGTFVFNYLHDVDPWAWVVHGDPEVRQHVHGSGGSLLLAVVVLAIGGIIEAARRRRAEPWWWFAAFALVVSPVPGSITFDRMHTLRMVALPILLLVFSALALAFLLERPGWTGRPLVAAAVVAAVVQGALFQWQFRSRGSDRVEAYEATYERVLDHALARRGPVHVLLGDHTYADALWYGVLQHVSDRIVVVPDGEEPPAGTTVVGRDSWCAACTARAFAHEGQFVAYAQP